MNNGLHTYMHQCCSSFTKQVNINGKALRSPISSLRAQDLSKLADIQPYTGLSPGGIGLSIRRGSSKHTETHWKVLCINSAIQAMNIHNTSQYRGQRTMKPADLADIKPYLGLSPGGINNAIHTKGVFKAQAKINRERHWKALCINCFLVAIQAMNIASVYEALSK